MTRDMSPEAVKLRLAKLYEGALEKDAYLEKVSKEKPAAWNPPEKKYPVKIKNADDRILESHVKDEIDDYIKEKKLFHKRINTQGQVMMTGPNTARFALNTMKGMSDIYLCLDGISVWAELKRPTGSYTQSQKNFIEDVIMHGGIAGIVTCVQDLERLLEEARILRKKASTPTCKERLLKIAFAPQDYTI